MRTWVVVMALLAVPGLGACGGRSADDATAARWPGTIQLGTSAVDIGAGVGVDATGNLFVTGSTDGALDRNVSAGGRDLFLVKYDASGSKLWTTQLGTASDDIATGVAMDRDGNALVTGVTYGGFDGVANAGWRDVFLVKCDASGHRLWTRQLGTASDDIASGVAVDASGNAFVTGSTGGALDGNGSVGAGDAFLVKYDASGNELWAAQFGTSATDDASAVAVDASGDAFVAGVTYGGLDGNTSAGGADLFLVKYEASGKKLWTRQLGTSADDHATGVAVDASGNAFVTGVTAGGLDGNTNAGGSDAFLVKYDGSGHKLWTMQLGTSADDRATGVAVDASGNAFVTGYTGGFDGKTGAGTADPFLVKYDASGTQLWTRRFGAPSWDDYANAVAVDASGDAFVTGITAGGLDGHANAGAYDVFLVKYDAAGNEQ